MIIVHREAQLELKAAAERYAAASPGLGHRFLARVEQAMGRIQAMPLAFSRWDDAGQTRRAGVRDFPFAIVFLIFDGRVFILAFAHTRRRPGYWRERRPDDGRGSP